MRYTKRAAAEKAAQHANEFRDILASHDSRYGPRADANGGEMKGTYYIGANPRTAIPVVVAGSQLIATGFAEVTDPAVYWLSHLVQPGDVVDQIGSCSIRSNGIDPRATDGGATFQVETEGK